MLIHSCQSQLYSHTQMQRFACGSRLVEHWTMMEKPPEYVRKSANFGF